MTAWHHGSPTRPVLDTPRPPFRSGRYHRAGGRPTWYGSSTEGAAWAEFARALPDGTDPTQFQRRLARVSFDVVALDLASPAVHRALGIEPSTLVSDDLEVCQTLADLAADAGFEAVVAPSAAAPRETTLAVFDAAIAGRSHDVSDYGVRTPPTAATPR